MINLYDLHHVFMVMAKSHRIRNMNVIYIHVSIILFPVCVNIMYIVLCLYLVDVWWSIVVGKDSLCDLFCLDYLWGIFGLGNCL